MNQVANISMLSERLIIFIVVITIPLGPLATDLYLPSLPAIAAGLHTSIMTIQITFSLYILGLGLSQLFYGPLSDRFGRRSVIQFGTAIFLVSSIGCMLSLNITSLWIFRLLQGIGFGCGFVVATAIMGDTFAGKKLAKISTFSAMAYSITPIIAPVIGGYIQTYLGWRANFGFMAFYSLFLLICLFVLLPETHKEHDLDAVKFKSVIGNYWEMTLNKNFMSYVLVMTLSYGLMIAFSIIAPFLFQLGLGLTPVTYGQLVLLVGFSYFVGTTTNGYLLKEFSVSGLILTGILLMLLGSVALLVFSLFDWFSVFSVLAPTCIALFGMGLIFPNAMAKALELYPQKTGRASALMGSYILLGCTLISVVAAHIHKLTEEPLGLIYTILSLLCLLIIYVVMPKKSFLSFF